MRLERFKRNTEVTFSDQGWKQGGRSSSMPAVWIENMNQKVMTWATDFTICQTFCFTV